MGFADRTWHTCYRDDIRPGINGREQRRDWPSGEVRHVSHEWHKFLQFVSAQEASMDAGQKQKRQSSNDDMQHAQMAL
jgi:hypothetical protein